MCAIYSLLLYPLPNVTAAKAKEKFVLEVCLTLNRYFFLYSSEVIMNSYFMFFSDLYFKKKYGAFAVFPF